jgi:hypothetical protein
MRAKAPVRLASADDLGALARSARATKVIGVKALNFSDFRSQYR